MEFTFVSGNLGLDLAGTVQHRRTDRQDLLASPEDLARWAVAAGLVDTAPPADGDDLDRAVRLREAIYRLASGHLTGVDTAPSDRELLNAAAALAPVVPRLGAGGKVERTGSLDAVLSDVARAAVELLGGPDAGLIRECGAEECTRLYVDTSRRSTRRWCDMRQCGNRAKAAAFRARHRV